MYINKSRGLIDGRRFGVTLGMEFGGSQSAAAIWYDNSAYHTLPVALNQLNNARLNTLLDSNNKSIVTSNKPLVLHDDILATVSL